MDRPFHRIHDPLYVDSLDKPLKALRKSKRTCRPDQILCATTKESQTSLMSRVQAHLLSLLDLLHIIGVRLHFLPSFVRSRMDFASVVTANAKEWNQGSVVFLPAVVALEDCP